VWRCRRWTTSRNLPSGALRCCGRASYRARRCARRSRARLHHLDKRGLPTPIYRYRQILVFESVPAVTTSRTATSRTAVLTLKATDVVGVDAGHCEEVGSKNDGKLDHHGAGCVAKQEVYIDCFVSLVMAVYACEMQCWKDAFRLQKGKYASLSELQLPITVSRERLPR
jgi:hypothetical protein